MLSDKQYDDKTKQLLSLYQDIESELLVNIAKRFPVDDKIGGTLEWQISKLNELGALNQENIKVIAKYAKVSERMVHDVIDQCKLGNINERTLTEAFDDEAIKVDPAQVLQSNSIANIVEQVNKEVQGPLKMIQTKALESARDAYMLTIQTAYLETSSGIYDYNTSIRRALTKLADAGITGVTYKRSNGSIMNYSIEAAVRRDVLTATRKVGNEVGLRTAKELGTNYVEVSEHMKSRPEHAVWQGKVYMLEGSNEEYGNFYIVTEYGTVTGLGGPNCHHTVSPFILGISELPKQEIDQEENKRVYDLTQEQRKLERQVRHLRKQLQVQEASNDKESVAKTNKLLNAKRIELKKFISQHKELREDYTRTEIQKVGNTTVSSNVELSSNEEYAVKSYVSGKAYTVNEKLRSESLLDDDDRKFVKDFDSALTKIPHYKGAVTRSLEFSFKDDLNGFLVNHEVGKKVVYHEYIATTALTEIYNPAGNVQLMIEDCTVGRNLIEYNQKEMEVVYERGSVFKVLNRIEIDSVTYILLKEVLDGKENQLQ